MYNPDLIYVTANLEEDRLLNDRCSEGEAIGTTMRGIGPCYRDKVGRSFAVRLGDLYRDSFRSRIEQITTVGRRQNNDVIGRRKAVHLHQNLV